MLQTCLESSQVVVGQVSGNASMQTQGLPRVVFTGVPRSSGQVSGDASMQCLHGAGRRVYGVAWFID